MIVSAVILAGGAGRRMGGCNKALLKLGPDDFIERLIRACLSWTDDAVVVSNDVEFADLLMKRYPVRVAADLYPGEGPLAGLHAGMTAARGTFAWLLACDQPLADARAAALLCDRLNSGDVTAALPVIDGRPQPFHAIYRRREAAAAAEELLRQGERRLGALLDRLPWIGVEDSELALSGVPQGFADDVDTPEDYERINRRAQGKGGLPS